MIGNDVAHEANIIVQCGELAVPQIRAGPVRNNSFQPKPSARLNSNVEAVGKPHLKKMQKSVRDLASQKGLYGTISPSGMVNVPPYLPRTLRRGVFLQPR
jgi:hypothetical protein